MKKLILIILFAPLLLATDWYVDKEATGLNNGTSPTNAWESFADINWASMSNGDDLYISGGGDSIIYYETLAPELRGTAANHSIIRGYNGKVIIDGSSQTREGISLLNAGSGKPSYLEIRNMTIQNVTYGMYANFDEAHDVIKFDSLTILNHGERAFEMVTLLSYNVDSIFVENSRLVSDTYYNGESDGIYFTGTHHNFVHNNYIRVPNQQPTAHVDALQGYQTNGWVITNNILINDSVYSTEGGGIPIILGSEGTNPVIIYNNLTYMGGVWYDGGAWAGVLMTRWYDTPPMPDTWIIHNTVIANGPRVRGMWLEYATGTTTHIINNIIAQYSTDGADDELSTFDNSTGSNLPVDSCKNNLFYKNWTSDVDFAGNFVGSGGSPTGTPANWSAWTTTYGGTGVKGDPDLIYQVGYEPDQGTLTPEIGGSSVGLNQGYDAEWVIDYLNSTYGLNGRLTWTDMYGTTRDAAPDIGAFEYTNQGWSAPDTIPIFSFTAQTNKEINTEYVATSPITGVDSVSHFWTTTSASFKINYNGTYSTAMKTADPDNGADTIYVKNTSSSSYSTLTTETIVGGGHSEDFDVTTKADPAETIIIRILPGKIIKVK